MKGRLYLIPNTLGDSDVSYVIPSDLVPVISEIKHYIVENVRNARRFLKKVNRKIDIDQITFYELNKRTKPYVLESFLKPINEHNIGILSEAGCPGVADPGADVVKIAHSKGIQVVPLVGPSSILLAMMASGFNGQNFAFNGYLPIKPPEIAKAIKHHEGRAYKENQSQLFIETPYRNVKIFQSFLKNCDPETMLCVACDITLESEYIKSFSIKEWKKMEEPAIHKRPAIFILHKA